MSHSRVLTVSQLNHQVRNLLEYEIGEVCVEGEISNLSKPASGHFYFSLKDKTAQIRCVYFRNRSLQGFCLLENGHQVQAKGKLSLYEARGDYQLIIETLSEAGFGDLYQQFESLKNKLKLQGLFEARRKKNIPEFPQLIGVITSANSAALRDILITLARRFPVAKVVVYPSEVQGKQAAQQLVEALTRANQQAACEVLILARGGGSMEDLWSFNDEQLAYAIANSHIPVVTGIGHETDFTIADFVADFRAATPTAAAETVSPNQAELIRRIETLHIGLIEGIRRSIQHQKLLLSHQIQKIASPKHLIFSYWQTLDYLTIQLHRGMQQQLHQKKFQLTQTTQALKTQHPSVLIQKTRSQLNTLTKQLVQHLLNTINQKQQSLIHLKATLHAFSPLATLQRGYAIVTHQNQVVYDSKQVNIGGAIHIRLAKGTLSGTIIDHDDQSSIDA